MAKRKGTHSHYEVMFEHYLRKNQILYIAVDENRQPLVEGKPVKNFDFIVSSFNGKYLIDVKGKNFSVKKWANWVHEEDLSGLKVWGNHFNAFVPLLVIPYWIENPENRKDFEKVGDIRKFKGRMYGILAVKLSDFYSNARLISKKWKAIDVERQKFFQIARPLSYFIPEFNKEW